jgi:hypothetical protein
MDFRLPEEAAELFAVAQRRFERLGGVELARRAELDPDVRIEAQKSLHELGLSELDVRADADQLLAGAVLCRAAGAVALPWPVVPELLRLDDRFLVLVDPAVVRIDHGSLEVDWVAAELSGSAWSVHSSRPGVTQRLGPFVVGASLGEACSAVEAADVGRYLTLQSWTILGALERAVADVVAHLRARHQFGHALSQFQAIRFTMADVAVALRGLEQLTKLTTWRLGRGDAALADAMAVRLHAADVAVSTLRAAHQFYGALGFCDETDLSVLDRHLQPTLRYPQSAERFAQALVPYVRDRVLAGRVG